MPADPPSTPSDHPIIAFFDVDNTLMRGTSIFHVGREAWAKRMIGWRDIATFAWQQRRFISVGENHEHLQLARERALGLAKGHTESEVLQLAEGIWDHRIKQRLWPETVALAQEHMAKGHEVWLISATPWEIGDLIARKLGLTGALGTHVEAVDGIYTGNLVGHVLHAERKAVAAEELASSIGADLADCWAYSDSRNDIPLLELVGHRVVVNPDAALARHARANDWPVLQLKTASIKEAEKRVRREARGVRREARRKTKQNPATD